MLNLYIRVKGLNLRDIAAETGISTASLSRIQNGKTCDMRTFARLIQWLISEPTVQAPIGPETRGK